MLKVGLTGSIAVGKSFVCEVFRERGFAVLDADLTAREVVAKGTPGLAAVVEEFGEGVLNVAGEMDRKKVGAIVFSDEKKRAKLNSIVHPLVIDAQNEWIEAQTGEVVIIDAALMIESGGYKRFDKLVVVWCESNIQLQRLMARDGFDETTARARIAAQMPQAEKKRFADYLIDTSNGFADTRAQVDELCTVLRDLASNKK